MPYIFKEPHHPDPWRVYRRKIRSRVIIPYIYLEWLGSWAAWFLGRSVLLEVLEYCGTLSILVGVIFYFAGAKDRLEQKHYQAWQVINTAQGKGGSGGRIDALQELNADGVALTGVELTDAFLVKIKLPHATLDRASLSSADLREAVLNDADIEEADIVSANLRGADLRNVRFAQSNLRETDFTGADFSGSDLKEVSFFGADLRKTNLANIINWKLITNMKLANIFGCQNPPPGFVDWALAHGAVQIESDDQWDNLVNAMDTTQPAK